MLWEIVHVTQEDKVTCFFTDYRTKSRTNPQLEDLKQATPPLRCSWYAHNAGPIRFARGDGKAESGMGMGSGAAGGETQARPAA